MSKLVFYAITEKYSPECVLYFAFPIVSLFLPQVFPFEYVHVFVLNTVSILRFEI